MLSVLAALVPVVTSLYAAGSVLVEQMRAADEQRRRYRIAALVGARRELLSGHSYGSPAYLRAQRHVKELDELLHRVNGLAKSTTYRDVNVALQMSTSVAPVAERRRQWVLLLGASTGVVLLAIGQSYSL